MSFINADLIRETSTTTGTGDYTLAGAVAGYSDFDSVMNDQDLCEYLVYDGSSGWETGVGKWKTGDLLERVTIIGSSNSNNAVNWSSGTRTVDMILSGRRLTQPRGCFIRKTTAQTAAAENTWYAVTWDTEVWDSHSIHDNATNNTRMTVPTPWTVVRISACIYKETAGGVNTCYPIVKLRKNGTEDWDGNGVTQRTTQTTLDTSTIIHTPPIIVTPGDYFEVYFRYDVASSGASNIDILTDYSFAQMELLA